MNAIEMAQKYLNNVENNRKNRISSVISNDKRSLDEIVNTYINNYSPKYTSEDYKNIYKNELKKQKDIRKDIDTSFANQGVQTNTGYFTTQRNILPVQQQSEITKNKKFEVYDNALQKNKEIEKKFQNIKNSDEYKKQEKNLIEQSNKVAYSKYDYDKAVVDEDNIGWYDKSLGTVIQGAKSVFDISGGLVKNENGDNYFLPNKTELKQQKVQDSYDTKIGKLLGGAGYEIGRIGATTAINQILPGVGSSMYFGRMFMDSTNNAISEGYDSGSAIIYGAVNTATEYLVGKALGSATKGLTGGKSSGYEELLNKTFNKIIKKPLASKILANAGSEATEEFIQEYLDNLNKIAILEKSTNVKDYTSIFTNEEVLSDAVYSALVGAITGGTLGTISGEDINIQNPTVYETLKIELEETKQNTTNQETINKIDNIINSINNFSEISRQLSEYEELKKQNKLTKEQQQQIAKLEEQLNELQKEVDNQNNVAVKEKNNMPTVNDIVEQEQKTSNVNLPSSKINSSKVNLPTVNDLVKNSINTNNNTNQSLPMRNLTFEESASKYNIDVNNDTIRSISKLMSNRGINARFDSNLFNDTNTNAVWIPTTNKSGQIVVREVVFNPNADTNQLLQDVAVHEIYHDIVSNDKGDVLNHLIQSFNMNIEGFNKARQELAEMYAKNYPNLDQNSTEFQNIVNEEVVASILGKKLGSQEYINRLVHEKPSIAKRIYDFVVDKLNQLNKLVGYKNEKLFWEDVKNKFEKAYREEYNSRIESNSIEKYSTIGMKGAKNLEKNSDERRYNQLYSYLKTAKDIADQNKGKSFETRNIETKKQTQWYQTKYGDWATIISDKDSKLIKQLVPNRTYKLGEVLKHDLLYKAYPGLENLKVKTVDSIKTTAGLEKMKLLPTNVLTTEILLKNSDINKKDFRKSILHEVNHFIQGYEKFNKNSRGASSSKMTIEEYRNNLGEIISNEAKILADLTQEKLDNIILFEQGKSNPQDKNIRKALDLSNKMDRSDLSDNINTSRYSTQNKNQVASETNIENDRNNRLKKSFHDEELDNSSFSFKQKQLDIILENNPVHDNYHTWIRTVDDIKTFEETLEDNDYKEYYEAGENFDETYSADMARKAIETGKITIYSSYPIEQGIFVSPSRMEAESYSGNGKVYSKEVNLTDVAWIDPTQGQYAKVNDTKYFQNNSKWQEYLDKNYKSEGTGKTLQDIKLPTRKVVTKINMPPVVNEKVSKKSKEIAKTLNETIRDDKLKVKQRKWTDTALESDVVKDEVFLADLDFDKISYVVQSNKKTLDNANNQLNTMGYEESVKYIQSKINDNNISLTDIALAERLIQEAIKQGDTGLASELIMDTAIIGTDLGQKVQALSLIQRLTPEGQLKFYQKLVTRAKVKGDKSFQNVEITPEMVELILNAYNSDGTFDQNDLNERVEQFKGKIAEQLVTTNSEKLVAWRYLSMLGNPKTHIRNIVSNIAMWGTLKVKNATARTLETILPVKNRTKTWEKASKEVSDYARKTTEEMKNVITGENKYNEKTSIERKKQTFDNKTLEKIKDFNSNMLSKEDWLFSSKAFEGSFREYLTAQGIKTNEDIANNAEIIEKAKLYAIEQSEIATFRQYSWLANQISKIENKNLATKLVVGSTIPFKKTPINVAKTGVKYSPIGLLKTISYDAYQVSKGNMEASQFIDNLSQGITGTSLTLIGYVLAKAGLLKGAGDDDKEGKYDSYLGNQTYSIKIGNSTYSISWLSPVAMPLLVGATAYEKLEEQSDWDMNVLVDTLAQTLDPLSEMSFLSSLDDVLSSYDSGIKKFAGMVGSMGQNYLTQFIPTLFSQMASTLDDKKRSTRASNDSSWKFGEETVRKVMYKLPILRNQLEVSTDIWGNEQEQSDNIIGRAFENFIAPYSRKEDISTLLDKELKRLYNSTGETGVIPGVPKAYVKYKDVTYQMSAKEYTKYKKTYGNTANTYLTKLVENENYRNATDEQKANMVKEIYSYASALANEEYFSEKEVNYENDTLKEMHKIKELNMSNTQIAEYVAQKKIISSIKTNEDLTTPEKKKEISKYLINAKLNDKQLAYLYDKYYSSEKVLDSLLNANIPIKEYIKFNSQEFTTDYYANGKAITNSRKNKVINYVNGLNLTIPQKAILIKMEYSGYTGYDNQIVNYINNMNYSKFEKASLLKSFGFDNYDKYLIDYVNNMNETKEEKMEILEEMGFTIRNGKVYS